MSNIKVQGIIAYLGLIPIISISIDLFFIGSISHTIIYDFFIFYTLIIYTFIGAMNWDVEIDSSIIKTFYGAIPSLISFILIVLTLLRLDYEILASILIVSLLSQLILDYMIYCTNSYKSRIEFYYFVRCPVTLFLCSFLALPIYLHM